jgi:hypothetical protein
VGVKESANEKNGRERERERERVTEHPQTHFRSAAHYDSSRRDTRTCHFRVSGNAFATAVTVFAALLFIVGIDRRVRLHAGTPTSTQVSLSETSRFQGQGRLFFGCWRSAANSKPFRLYHFSRKPAFLKPRTRTLLVPKRKCKRKRCRKHSELDRIGMSLSRHRNFQQWINRFAR